MAAKQRPRKSFTDLRIEELESELLRRKRAQLAESLQIHQIDFTDKSFAAQTSFIESKARAKVAFCTRRAGKSEGAAIYCIQEGERHPNSTILYLAKTRKSAKSILWRLLQKWLVKLNIGYVLNRTDLCITLDNGSIIQLAGVDATVEERSKFLGLPNLRLVLIDECQAHRTDLYQLVVSTLMPGLIDVGGTICLLGTPGNYAHGLYYRLTEPGKREDTDPVFEIHTWTAYDNPYMASKWAAEIEEIKRTTPARLETPEFISDYLGRWSVDEGRRVYKFKDSRNTFSELPTVNKWTVIMGIDLGYEDDTAFSVLLYSKESPVTYCIYAFKQKKMIITDVVTKLRKLIARFHPEVLVCDMASKQAVMEMVVRHGIPLIAADKTGKTDFIELMNHDLISGTFKVAKQEMQLVVNGEKMNAEGTELLINEWGTLIWADPVPGSVVRKEHPGCSNHLADSTYYAWRYTHSHMGVKPAPKVEAGSPEWVAQQHDAMRKQLEKQREEQKQKLEVDNWGWSPPAGSDWSGTGIL